MKPGVVVREVWSHNLESEIRLIGDLLPLFSVVSFDTEFPGTVIDLGLSRYDIARLDPPRSYDLMRRNVNETQIIQLGLAISTPEGDQRFIWQFNFRDFDLDSHSHSPDSIALLRKQGIDFARNRKDGIDSSVKHMVKGCDGLYGGLDKVAAALGVAREAGNSHQAGSDSLLTLQTFLKLEKEHFRDKEGLLEKSRCILHSLGRMVFDPRFRLNIQTTVPIPILRPYCYVPPQPPHRFHLLPQPHNMVMLRNNNSCAYGY